MANEILYSGLGDLRLPAILSKEVLLLLADRGLLRNHPALVYAGDAVGTGTATIKVGAMGLMGYDVLTSVVEGQPVGNTALTDDSFEVTVARYSKRYEASDLARLTDSYGWLTDPALFSQDAVLSADVTLTRQIAQLPQGFTASVGTSGSNFTVADYYAATAQLEMENVQGPYLSMLHPAHWGQFRLGLRTEGGPMQWQAPTAELLRIRGDNYKGNFLGVDIFTCDGIPSVNAGADYASGMWGRGAVIYADATIPPDATSGNVQLFLGKIMVEFDRDATRGLKGITTNYYFGVLEGIDEAGVKIVAGTGG